MTQTIKSHRLLVRGARVMVGVSGGPDSVTLLHVLLQLQSTFALKLYVIHVDHQLRPESASDARWVEAMSERLGLPAIIERCQVRRYCKENGCSLEDGARRVRYACFKDAALRHSIHGVALAHTADDQAETVLMRFLRGSGLTGLSGIPIKRPLSDPSRSSPDPSSISHHPAPNSSPIIQYSLHHPSVDFKQSIWIVRPLLEIWREDVLAYLAKQNLSYREDASNQDLRFVRNRIRHELLPLLRQSYNPNIKAALLQLAQQSREDASYLQQIAKRQWKRLTARGVLRPLALRIERFRSQPKAIQRQLIRHAVTLLRGDLREFEFKHWLEIERLFEDRPLGTVVDLPSGLQFVRRQEVIVACRETSQKLAP